MATVGVIHIGTFASADTIEDDFDKENDNVYAGTHDDSVLLALTVGVTEPQGDGIAYDDDQGQTASQITYDIGAATVTAAQDSVATYNVSILLDHGATFINENIDGASLDGLNIQSVTLGTVVQDNAIGWYTARSAEGARIVCFVKGTLIATPDGPRAVETLQEGAVVLTLDQGAQPVIWRAVQQVSGNGATAPVEIAAGALGQGIPYRPLLVSPQHRVLLKSPIAVRMLGHDEALVAAKRLCGVAGISRKAAVGVVGYHHLMLAQHGILGANGAATESFFPGSEAIKALEAEDLARLQVHLHRRSKPYNLCRTELRGQVCDRLLARHHKNQKPLFQRAAQLAVSAQ